MTSEQSQTPSPNDHSEPDVAIREASAILYRARKILDSITGNEGQVEALWNIVHKTDAELGYAAWQAGVLKGQLRRERRAKAELEARLETLIESLQGQEPKHNNG